MSTLGAGLRVLDFQYQVACNDLGNGRYENCNNSGSCYCHGSYNERQQGGAQQVDFEHR